MLGEEHNTSILEAIKLLLRRDDADALEGFTEEELAELDERRARRLSGESKGYSSEQSIRMLRAAQAKDEAV